MMRRLLKASLAAVLVYATAAHAAAEYLGVPMWPWRHLV